MRVNLRQMRFLRGGDGRKCSIDLTESANGQSMKEVTCGRPPSRYWDLINSATVLAAMLRTLADLFTKACTRMFASPSERTGPQRAAETTWLFHDSHGRISVDLSGSRTNVLQAPALDRSIDRNPPSVAEGRVSCRVALVEIGYQTN